MWKIGTSLESPITFDEGFKVNLVPFFILGLNLLSCELNKFYFKVCWASCYIDIALKQNKFSILSCFLLKNLK